jgi:hypothetical protein
MMERSSVELSKFKVNIPIIAATAEEAYPREKIAVERTVIIRIMMIRRRKT